MWSGREVGQWEACWVNAVSHVLVRSQRQLDVLRVIAVLIV